MQRLLAALFFAALVGVSNSSRAFTWPSAPAKVARALQNGDVAERRQAADLLAKMPEPLAAPLLLKALSDQDYEVRLRAARSAMRLRSMAALEAVLPWLSDADPRARLLACELIRSVPTPKGVLALGRVLGDPDANVRIAAATAMGASGMPEAVGPLLGHLDDPAPNVRAEVAGALARIGDSSAAVPLIGKVSDSAPEVRRAVVRSLGELGDPRAASALILALRDTVAQVRVEALTALGRLGSQEAVLAITPLLEDRASPEVRVAAIAALGRIGSEAAISALIKALAADDPTMKTSAIRDALAASGPRAVPYLESALESYGSNPNVAAGAALVLGSLKNKKTTLAVVQAVRKGTVDPYSGLRALTDLSDPAALPTVLELLTDANVVVRRQAVLAVTALLDPTRHDGRAVEPLEAALGDSRITLEEKTQIARALGRTGSARALKALLPLLDGKILALRLAALDALGALGPMGQDVVLLHALDDDNATVRLHAALSLATSAGEASVASMLERLTEAAVEDRVAIGIALSGALSRGGEQTVEKVKQAMGSASGGIRDALIEGLGRLPADAAGTLLGDAARESDGPDRRKIAEALAGHPEQLAVLTKLFGDPDPSVRAQAAFSAGALPSGLASQAVLARVKALSEDRDLDVASNAVAAASLLSKTLAESDHEAPAKTGAWLCKALGDYRAYVRANALAGLGVLGLRCGRGDEERRLLAMDPSEAVRLRAARLIAGSSGKEPAREDTRALARCVTDDKSGSVAVTCRAQKALPIQTGGALVFIVPDGRSSPLGSAPYSLERPDGLIRSGTADRRGAVFERAAPVRLLVPGALSP